MLFKWFMRTFSGIGWWHARLNYPREDTFIVIPVYSQLTAEATAPQEMEPTSAGSQWQTKLKHI